MRILVTGGCGFIGSNFVKRLYSQNDIQFEQITVLDKLTYAGVLENLKDFNNRKDFEFVKGDICDSNLLKYLLPQVDVVINFAAESHVDRSITNSNDFVKTNVLGVQNILESIRNFNSKIRFLQVSTDEVYGFIQKGSWMETSPLLPNSPYSASKAGGELIARSYFRTHDLDVLVSRCSNNYGPYHFPEKLIPLTITNLLQGRKVPIYGNGMNVRDWIHVDDHCDALIKILKNGKSGEIYNIGTEQEFNNIEVINFILEILGFDQSAVEFVADRKGHDYRYAVNCDKARSELDFKPSIDFADGIKSTIDWYVDNETWWKNLANRIKD